jgi:hypothetical protein
MAKAPKQNTPRLNAAKRKLFFGHLAETANVAASARLAGISGNTVYAERRRSPAFRAAWSEALAEGYARLEADLLAEALRPANGKASDTTLKARAQKLRLGTTLFSAHRASVRAFADTPRANAMVDLGVLKTQLILKLTQMRDRAGISLDGTAKANGEGQA